MAEATHLGNFIRECRKGLKYTSREVARLSSGRSDLPSISNSYLISVENGKHIPRLDKIIALAEVLNIPVVHLVDRCREDLGERAAPSVGTGEFRSLFQAGREHADGNDHASALRYFRQAWQVARSATDGDISRPEVTELRLQIANCYRRLKINRVAKEEAEELLKLRDLEPRFRSRAAFLLTELYREEGNTLLASILAREALRLAIEAGDEALEGKLLSALGSIALEERRFDDALGFYRDASAKLKRLGEERAALLARTCLGLVLIEKREHFRAIELLRGELSMSQDRDPYVRGGLHIAVAKAYYGAENYKSARSHARSARDCAEKLDTPDLAFLAYYYLFAVARIERDDQNLDAYLERLTHYRDKLAVSFQEVESYDRLVKHGAEKGVVR